MTTDDLVSRKSLFNTMLAGRLHFDEPRVPFILVDCEALRSFVEKAISATIVEPLDDVCAILAATHVTPPCVQCERALGEAYCQEKECGCGSKAHWKAYFVKLMEGMHHEMG